MEDTKTISEVVVSFNKEAVEEVDTIIEVEEATIKTEVEVVSITNFLMEIQIGFQVKTTRLLNASSSNLLVNVNLVTNALLPMVMINLDKLH